MATEANRPAEAAPWLSYPDAQKFSSLGRTKLWELVSSGEVRAAKVGRAVRINRDSLNQYLERSDYARSK